MSFNRNGIKKERKEPGGMKATERERGTGGNLAPSFGADGKKFSPTKFSNDLVNAQNF